MSICTKCKQNSITEIVKDNQRHFYCSNCKQLFERVIDSKSGRIAVTNAHDGTIRHLTVGGVLERDGKMLLIKRRGFPFGYDIPAGHIEFDEKPSEAVKRELLEETGLRVKKSALIFNDIIDSQCKYGSDSHVWYLYRCDFDGEQPFLNNESESYGWYPPKEIRRLNLIPSAKFLMETVLLK